MNYLTTDFRGKLHLAVGLHLLSSLVNVCGVGLVIGLIFILSGDRAIFPFIWNWLPVDTSDSRLVYLIGLPICVLLVLRAVLSLMVQRYTTGIIGNLVTETRLKLISSYQQKSLLDHQTITRAGYIRGIEFLSRQLGTDVRIQIQFIGEVTLVLGILGVTFTAVSPWVIAIAIAIGCVFACLDWLTKKRLTNIGQSRVNLKRSLVSLIIDNASAYRELKVSGRQEFFSKGLRSLSSRLNDFDVFLNVFSMVPRLLGETCLGLALAVGLIVLYSTEGAKEELLASLLALGFAALRIIPSLSLLSSSLGKIRASAPAISKLKRELNGHATHLEARQTSVKSIRPHFSCLRLRGITFRYSADGPYILDGVDIDLRQGSLTGITGPSGGGKSTLIDIMLGLITPERGNIFLDERLISTPLYALQNFAYYLPQEATLLNNSLKNNIVLQDSLETDEDRLSDALRIANLEDAVNGLLEKEHTMLGDRGENISGGQRQRVALARALYSGRTFLVLDETLNALDQNAEQKIIDNLLKIQPPKTIVVVTHRPSVLARCDQVYTLASGALAPGK